jgi:hypothetical protein
MEKLAYAAAASTTKEKIYYFVSRTMTRPTGGTSWGCPRTSWLMIMKSFFKEK